MNTKYEYETADGLLVKVPDAKSGVSFRQATVLRRAIGDGNGGFQSGSLLAPATRGSSYATDNYDKPAASWILDSTGNVLLGLGSLFGNTKLGAHTSTTENVNINTNQRTSTSFSFVEVRTLAIAAVAVALVVAVIVFIRKRKG